MNGIGAVIVVILILVLYLLPTFIASKDHPNPNGLFWLNILLGWTFIGWVIALVWAFAKKQPIQHVYYQPQQKEAPQVNVADELLKWKKLFDEGVITQEQFNEKKETLMPTPKAIIQEAVVNEPSIEEPKKEMTPTKYLFYFYILKYKYLFITLLIVLTLIIGGIIFGR